MTTDDVELLAVHLLLSRPDAAKCVLELVHALADAHASLAVIGDLASGKINSRGVEVPRPAAPNTTEQEPA
jgi:hypothetical protein